MHVHCKLGEGGWSCKTPRSQIDGRLLLQGPCWGTACALCMLCYTIHSSKTSAVSRQSSKSMTMLNQCTAVCGYASIHLYVRPHNHADAFGAAHHRCVCMLYMSAMLQ